MERTSSFLPRISVRRPVTVTMGLVALLMLGLVAYFRIPVKLMPSGLTPPFLYVRISYRNATPQETEQQITRPLEESLRTVKGIEEIRTYSDGRGTRAYLNFRQYTDMVEAYNQVSDRLERLKPTLPEAAQDETRIYKHNQDSWSIMWIGVALDSTITDTYRFLETFVQRPMERVDGVGRVDLWGVDEKEVMVEIDQERMRTRGVSMAQLVSTLRGDNFALAGGYVREGQKKFFVRSLARYRSSREIEDIQIRAHGQKVRLGDVATVSYDVPEKSWQQRINGKPSVGIGIKQESGANIVSVCDRVEAAMHRIENDPRTAGKVRFNVIFNQGFFIKESVRNLQGTGLWGGFFAALVLLFYLRTVRMTAIITLAIPLCVMITVTVLYFINWSMNVVTMMGLMVGVGLVVDNAIVILENIYRLRGQGESPGDSAIYGASEVGLAIAMATLTTVVVFLPMMLFSGDMFMNFYMTRMGIPVVVALLGSLFVALIFIPLASVRVGRGQVRPDPDTVVRARTAYLRMLNWTLSHRRDAVLIALILFASIALPMNGLKRGDSRGRAFNDLGIRLSLPSHFSLAETSDILAEWEGFLEDRRDAYGVQTVRVYYRPGFGYVRIYLASQANEAWWYVTYRNIRKAMGIPVPGPMDRPAVIEDIRKHMPKFVGIRTYVEGRSDGPGGDPSVSIYLEGEDTDVLISMVDEVERRLRDIPSVVSIESEIEESDDEVQVMVNREQAKRFGISAREIGQNIAFGLQGVPLPRLQSGEREVNVRLYLEREDRKNLNQLRNLPFVTDEGNEVALGELATFRVARGTGGISRVDGKTKLRIRALTARADLKGLYAEIDRAMQGFEMPRGYTWNKGERYRNMQESDESRNAGVVMAITCVFLLMGVLFESFILPFSVLFSIPFAFLGVYWTLYLTGTPMDIMASIGIIVLIGVVVNNAIVLVDMINRLRADGMNRTEAIIEGGRNRFRPILMTTFTTVFGLLPMAMGNSNVMGTPYAPLGRTMMGGLLSSTFLTLLVVPLFYTFLDDLRAALQRLTGAVFRRRAARAAYDGAADD